MSNFAGLQIFCALIQRRPYEAALHSFVHFLSDLPGANEAKWQTNHRSGNTTTQDPAPHCQKKIIPMPSTDSSPKARFCPCSLFHVR